MKSTETLPTPYFRTYANLNTAVLTRTADPAPNRRSLNCRIYVGGAGTVVVRPTWAADLAAAGDDITITAVAGAVYDIEAYSIVSGTATNVTVYWPRV